MSGITVVELPLRARTADQVIAMEENWIFNFTKVERPQGLPTLVEDIEKHFLEAMDDPNSDKQEIRWQLMRLYRYMELPEKAFEYANALLQNSVTPSQIALCNLKLGQIKEQIYDFKSAIEFYSRILHVTGPISADIVYYAYNNIGYSLNQLDRYKEAESYCRRAIEINPERYNAHKNLGVSLEGQGQFVEAAYCYILAVRKNAADPRALKHLLDLVLKREELFQEIEDLDYQVRKCKEAVTYAKVVNEQSQ